MKFYETLKDMECIAGDTLPEFLVTVETADDLGHCSMQLILSKESSPETPVVCKNCTQTEDGFAVQLDSEDTLTLRKGAYFLHFRLISGGKSYRKLAGTLYVRPAAEGDSA